MQYVVPRHALEEEGFPDDAASKEDSFLAYDDHFKNGRGVHFSVLRDVLGVDESRGARAGLVAVDFSKLEVLYAIRQEQRNRSSSVINNTTAAGKPLRYIVQEKPETLKACRHRLPRVHGLLFATCHPTAVVV